MLEQPPPPQRLVLSGSAGARYNPLGLGTDFTLELRQRLYSSSALPLQDNFLSLGLGAGVTPATASAGVTLSLQPLTLVTLFASATLITFFGDFGNLQSFPSPRADWSDQARDDLSSLPAGDPRRNYAATATTLAFGATLRGQLGPIAFFEQIVFTRSQATLRAGDRVYYDPIQAALVPNRGFLLSDELDVVFLAGPLAAGVQWSALHPYFGARHFAPGEPLTADDSQMRAGPVVAYRFFKEDGRHFNEPTVFLLVNWWLQDRYRTGAQISQIVPFLTFGFGFWGDLLPI